MKQFRCGYLYADGHAVLIFAKRDRDAGEFEFAEVHQRWTSAQLRFDGRLVLQSLELLRMAKRASAVHASPYSVSDGSDKTQELGIGVSSLTFEFGRWDYLCLTSVPGVLSAQWTYQPGVAEECPSPNQSRWGMSPVGRFVRFAMA